MDVQQDVIITICSYGAMNESDARRKVAAPLSGGFGSQGLVASARGCQRG